LVRGSKNRDLDIPSIGKIPDPVPDRRVGNVDIIIADEPYSIVGRTIRIGIVDQGVDGGDTRVIGDRQRRAARGQVETIDRRDTSVDVRVDKTHFFLFVLY